MVTFLEQFLITFLFYLKELWLVLALGFFLSGLFYYFIPDHIVEKYLGHDGAKSIFFASLVGVILPVCCVGSLPIALTLRRKGAGLGSILAFLVATPATSVSAFFVCWQLLGLSFATVIFIAVIITALILGFISAGIKMDFMLNEQGKKTSCCHDSRPKKVMSLSIENGQKMRNVFHYAYVVLPKEIGFEILIGIALASFVTVCDPIQGFIQTYLVGILGYAFVVIFGLITYVCSTASVPMANAFLESGMSQGQALCYLLVGPITSYGTILVIKKSFGWHILLIYLAVIIICSLLFGITFDLITIS